MTGFVRIVGWVAFAAGVLSIGFPVVFPEVFAVASAATLCAILIVAGTLLVGLAELLGIAERIQENTGWLEVGRPTTELSPVESQPMPASAAQLARDEELPADSEIDSAPTTDPDPIPAPAPTARPTNGGARGARTLRCKPPSRRSGRMVTSRTPRHDAGRRYSCHGSRGRLVPVHSIGGHRGDWPLSR